MTTHPSTPEFHSSSQGKAPFDSDDHVRRVSEAIARQSLEILNGVRPLSCLAKIVDRAELDRLGERYKVTQAYRSEMGIQVGSRVRAGRAHVCRISPTRIEANAVVQDNLRTRFVCMRWEKKRSGWKIDLLELG